MSGVQPRQQPLRLSFLGPSSLLLATTSILLTPVAASLLSPLAVVGQQQQRRDNNPLNIEWGPAPAPEDGPPLSAGALRDTKYLPIQIGAIVGAYGVSLVLVAILILILSKKRREHLKAADEEEEDEEDLEAVFFEDDRKQLPSLIIPPRPESPRSIPRSPVRNFSYPSPDRSEFFPSPVTPYISPSPSSTLHAPGVDFAVDQRVVAADRHMAQTQLEDMYKYVMEQEEAKAKGIILQGPPAPVIASSYPRSSTSDRSTAPSTLKKEKNKPAALNLTEEKKSRTSSILSALRSPKKKTGVRGISISSPMMTPKSATFPRYEAQEMDTIPPRHYAPPPPPPVPTDQVPFGLQRGQVQTAPISPDQSPESTQSIDERIGFQLPLSQPPKHGNHHRNISSAPTEADPISAASDHSQTPLVGLPTSPKPHVTRFPTLPASPKPGATFQRPNAPSAVRTGGALPLRAYEPSLASPSMVAHNTKQTTFERTGPLSPSGLRTPATGAAVPYSPYQPFTPCIPMTPSLVSKADRKRMKRLEPKTPTMEMVRDSEDVW
ncbi:hypothetical protein VD0004_g6435 [Verticillium dahliae]|uniref:Uncharacterized protein n=1 Tax=Verticillium dahliae TaxID=27337 RepID=A0A444RX87_VERDA|nr:hypothetical protein VD0004_g6435 [Verticillium dahliae]PNH71071.1 hypothetical protein VD0001_g6474 [Verticillium dahliae]RXG45782.1 hypothetical protein VDGE_01558 [Verticillium dahliae]